VPWWIREPGDVPNERPARPGDQVFIGLLFDDLKEEKICGESIGHVERIVPIARAEAASESDAKQAEQAPCGVAPDEVNPSKEALDALEWLAAYQGENNGRDATLVPESAGTEDDS
jgi:hypothetical protein